MIFAVISLSYFLWFFSSFLLLAERKKKKKWIKHCCPVRDLKYLLIHQGPIVWYMANSDISEKTMAPHSRTLAWKIPWMEEPGGLQSMGSLRVGHDQWLHFHFSLSCIGEGNATHSSVLVWRIQGLGSLVGRRLWGRTESDRTEAT